MAQRGAGLPANRAIHSRVVINPQAPAARRQSRDPRARRRGIQRQPGGAALGNPRLGDQQIGPPRQVQADHRATLRPAGDQFALPRHRCGRRVRRRSRSARPRSRPHDRRVRRAVARRISPRHSSRSRSGRKGPRNNMQNPTYRDQGKNAPGTRFVAKPISTTVSAYDQGRRLPAFPDKV